MCTERRQRILPAGSVALGWRTCNHLLSVLHIHRGNHIHERSHWQRPHRAWQLLGDLPKVRHVLLA